MGFDVPGTACFGAGLEICAEGIFAGFVPVAAFEVDIAEPAGFAAAAAGAAIGFTWPGISDDAVTG